MPVTDICNHDHDGCMKTNKQKKQKQKQKQTNKNKKQNKINKQNTTKQNKTKQNKNKTTNKNKNKNKKQKRKPFLSHSWSLECRPLCLWMDMVECIRKTSKREVVLRVFLFLFFLTQILHPMTPFFRQSTINDPFFPLLFQGLYTNCKFYRASRAFWDIEKIIIIKKKKKKTRQF